MATGRRGEFASLLRGRRLAAGWTQEELARRAGLSPRSVSDLERGTRRPYLRTVTMLAGALGLNEDERAELAAAASQPAADAAPLPLGDPAQPHRGVPRQLPAVARGFVGRAAELKVLSELLGLLDDPAGPVVISAINGTAGVGKTALAVRWAHQVAGQFPDGQLYVNLRGYDPDQPVLAGDALAGFLRALGVPGNDIAAETDERAARYRSLLAGRRVLVVLDNAAAVEQVRPLLPGSPTCAVVVTSRDALAGLVARDGARRLELDLLSEQDAAGLLRELIGERAQADPAATAELAVLCARLPLALRVAAEHAIARPSAPLAELAGELAGRQHRLDFLATPGDSRTAVRAVFSWSYRHLAPDPARLFRLAGLHPGPDFDRYAAAALAGTTLAQATRLLDELTGAHLVQPAAPGRYGLHDLLRAYARELSDAHDGAGEERAALTRLFDHYLYTAATAMDALYPAEAYTRPRVPAPSTPSPPASTTAQARAWLDAQRGCLLAAAAHTAAHGWPGHTTQLARTLFRYLETGCHAPEALTVHSQARRAAQRAGDHTGEAIALTELGLTDWTLGRYQRAADRLQQALVLFGGTDDRSHEARALGNLGLMHYYLCEFPEAVRHLQQALALYREAGDRLREARVLNTLGSLDMRLSRYQQAARYLWQALALHQEAGHKQGAAIALENLGSLELMLGHYQEAADYGQRALATFQQMGYRNGEAWATHHLGQLDLRQGRYQQAAERISHALAVFRETGSRNDEAEALASLGDVELHLGDGRRAVGHQQQALALFREVGDRFGETGALNGVGEASLAVGQPQDARSRHADALTLAEQIGDRYQQARAHEGLGHSHHALGQPAEASEHWQQALAVYTEIGVPQSEPVRGRLASRTARATD